MIPLIIILFGVTMLYVSSASRIESYIKALNMQGFLLLLLVVFDYGTIHIESFIFLCFETLVVKAIAIPLFITHIIRKNGVYREVDPNVTSRFSIIVTSIIFVMGFYFSFWAIDKVDNIRPFYFGISISTMVASIFIIITRKKIITHVMCYMMLENGIFLLALSIAREMPFIVAFGMLLDIFIAIYLFGLFVNKVQDTYSEVDITKLTSLKD